MFKKPLGTLKTSSPLKNSDRRKLKQRIIASYSNITNEEGDILVPDGILSVKFNNHVGEPGVAYLSPDGDPLWFTIGKNSDELIPTVYTLWKKQDLLPFLSTPSAVIPILVGGADLMIPGVIHCPCDLGERRIVAIRQYTRNKTDGKPTLSPPVAVGWMALPSNQLRGTAGERKGKAVHVAHTWKDHLWDMGSKKDIPPDTVMESAGGSESGNADVEENSESEEEEHEEEEYARSATPPPASEPPSSPTTDGPSSLPAPAAEPKAPMTNGITYTSEEISTLLNFSLYQAIATQLKSLPASAFPIPATQFYSTYILPSRPAFPTLALVPSSGSDSADSTAKEEQEPPIISTEISIKTSTHKSLTAFLKSAEKASLLTLKPPQKKASPDVLVTSVNAAHPNVVRHAGFATVRDVEATKLKKEKAEKEREGEGEGRKEVMIRELWKAHQESVGLVEGMGGSKNDLYTAPEIRNMLNSYITTHDLVNKGDQAYINLDDLLCSCIAVKQKSKGKGKDVGRAGGVGTGMDDEGTPEFMRRDELLRKVLGRMQSWYEVGMDGGEDVRKKGTLEPIKVVVKIRQGRKASTLITGFEPFGVVHAEEMAEDLRRVCAGSTSVSPIAGKPAGYGQEVLVQGKQIKAVVDYLMGKGIPKKWIEGADLSGSGKK